MNDIMKVEETSESQKVDMNGHFDSVFLPLPSEPTQENEINFKDDIIKVEKIPNKVFENDLKSEEKVKLENSQDEIVKKEIKDEKFNIENKKLPRNDDGNIKGADLLKSLLSASTATTLTVVDKMITTTEVTDEKLNLKKILYQTDKDKKETSANSLPSNGSDPQIDDDDRRLVIDISDDEKDGIKEKTVNGKSMPLLNVTFEDRNKAMRSFSVGSTENIHLRLSRHFMRSQSSK